MTSLWEKYAMLNVQVPPGAPQSTSTLRNLLRGSSNLKEHAVEVGHNAQAVASMVDDCEGLQIDVFNRNKVIIKNHKPIINVDGQYKIRETTRKRKVDESKAIRRNTPCANCGYTVFGTDFAIFCNICERTVHKGCWDKVYGRFFMTERLEWTTTNKKREPMRHKLCADCFHSNKGDRQIIVEKNSKLIRYASSSSRQGKYRLVEIPYSLGNVNEEYVSAEFSTKHDGQTDATDQNCSTKAKKKQYRSRNEQFSKKATPVRNADDEFVSCLVSRALDGLGYNINMIKYRQRMYAENDICVRRFDTQPDDRVTTGGKAEGANMYFESDTDYMFVFKNVVCAEDLGIFDKVKHMTCLQIETHDCPPGYTRLKLVKNALGHFYRDVLANSVIETDEGKKYLSNVRFHQEMGLEEIDYQTKDGYVINPTSGPSTPLTHRYDNFDSVMALRCYCPTLIGQWVTRPRRNNWPTSEDVQIIAQLEAHAVPVGFKGSQNQGIEWRICYSLAELYLMKSLNECQIHMYIVLKMLAKEHLQSISREITSYIMKNVTLWVCEDHPITEFQNKNFLDRLIDALKFLKKCLEEENLPSYMVQQRNLLAGRIEKDQAAKVTAFLEMLIKERAGLFLRISKVGDALFAMFKEPSRLDEFAMKRSRLERLVFLRCWIRENVWSPGTSRGDKFKKAGENTAYLPLQRDMKMILSFDTTAKIADGATQADVDNLWDKVVHKMLS